MLHQGPGRLPALKVELGRQSRESGGSEIAVELQDGDVVRLHLIRGVHIAGWPKGIDNLDRRGPLGSGVAVDECSCTRVEQREAGNSVPRLVACCAV